MADRTELVEIVGAPAAYPGVANASFSFNPDSVVIINEATAAADVVFVSFDGVTDAAKLVPGTASAGLKFGRQENDIFVRGVNAPDVILIAED